MGKVPKKRTDDAMIIPPLALEDASKVEIVRGPNIAPLPRKEKPGATLTGAVLLKTGDNITTDHIMPQARRCCRFGATFPRFRVRVRAVDRPREGEGDGRQLH
jgi:aconitate hydratase